jgi:DNA modification methylase
MTKTKKQREVPESAQLPKWRNRIVAHGEEDPTQLLANPKNWRIHPKAQKDAMAGVLAEVGWVQDVIVNKRTGFVLDGHLRVALSITAGERVPVVYVDLSEKEEALILATLDPLSAMATADEDLLAGLLGTLEVSDTAVQALLDELAGNRPKAGLTDADACPEPPVNPITVPGDLWLLGEHRLYCGDCTDPKVVAGVLDGREPILMVTDPPYGISLDSEWRDRAGLNGCGPAEASYMKHRTEGHTETTISGDTRADWSEAFELVPSLQVVYVWHASVFTREVLNGLERIGFLNPQQIIWNKGRTVLTRTHYWYQHEPAWYCRRPRAPWYGKAGENSTVWDAASPKFIMGGSKDPADVKQDHCTQKAVELMRRPILNHLRPGELVYEPFGGSGTTLIAAEVTGRVCCCIELEPKYCDTILTRWQEFTGQEATLEENGQTFAEIARSRTGAVECRSQQAQQRSSGDRVGPEAGA